MAWVKYLDNAMIHLETRTEIFSVQVYGEYLIGITQKFDEHSEDTPSIELLRTEAEVQRDLAWEALERELNPVELTEDMVTPEMMGYVRLYKTLVGGDAIYDS